jgi:hypothetical protein
VNATEVETLQVRQNLSERSNALGLKRDDRLVVDEVGTEKLEVWKPVRLEVFPGRINRDGGASQRGMN